MEDSDPDGPALLEWLNSLEAGGAHCTKLSDLADGRALLHVMHDISPDGFPSPAMTSGSSECVLRLLECLKEHLRDRGGRNDEICQQLLEQAKSGVSVRPGLLAKLTLVATVQNDLPRRRAYVGAIMGLSVEAQQAAQAIIERFLSGGGIESPAGASPVQEAAAFGACFSPPERPAARRSSHETPSFMEAGLDVETRFRRLKDEYISVMDEQDLLQQECTQLRKDLAAERERRRKAEEGEREANTELREAKEARERAREETRALYEGRLDQDAERAKQLLKQKDLEAEGLREELGLARSQVANTERLTNQLEICKQKLEEQHTLRRENEELRVQVDDLLARSGGGGASGSGHLQRSLARAREDAANAARERDEAQRQVLALKDEMERGAGLQVGLAEQLATARASGGTAASGEIVANVAGPGRSLALEAGAALLAAASGEASAGDVPGQRQRQDDMLERLLSEKERATRAETTLQVKSAELAALQEQRIKDVVKLATLEAQLTASKGQVLNSTGSQPLSEEAESKIQELESSLVLRERELQVLRMRETAEKESLHTQETLMASCFHDLGLRFHKMRLQDQLSQLKGSGSGSGAPPR